MSRAALLAELAREIRDRGAGRIGIDGVDGAGKTFLADELAAELGHDATRVRADDFLHPPEVRYRLGRDSPEGFFRDSFDHEAFVAAVVSSRKPVVADGIFLHRDELDGLWDYSIWLEVPFEISVPRGAARGDGFGDPDPAAPSNRRYVEGQRLYIARCAPRSRATVVIDNSDLERPVRG